MEGATGVLDVVAGGETVRYEWNGNPADRAAAKAAFDELMATGSYLAVVHDESRRSHQVRTFEDVERVERERGVVAAQISTALVGG